MLGRNLKRGLKVLSLSIIAFENIGEKPQKRVERCLVFGGSIIIATSRNLKRGLKVYYHMM